MTISAILVNHNGRDTILRSIRSLLQQGQHWEQILVVDNGSTDGSCDEIKQTFPSVRVLELGGNLGLSHARNMGLENVRSERVLILDDDVRLTPGSLQAMMDAMNETNAAVVCPRIVLYPQEDIVQCNGGAIHFLGMLILADAYKPVTSLPPVRARVNGFIGACLLCDTATLRRAGGFDEDYFFYFEDMELSHRMRALGYEILCEERALALHERGEGTKNLSFRGDGQYPARRAYFTLRNRWLTILLHFQLRTLAFLMPALLLYETLAFVEVLRRNWLKVYVRAVRSLLAEWRSILARRKKWQLLRVNGDAAILSGGPLPFSKGFVNEKEEWITKTLNVVFNAYWKGVCKWM